MKKIPDDEMLKILSQTGMERLRELLEEDEDFRFPTIKLNRSKSPKYELPEPIKGGDRDNIESESTFKAVVLVARKNFYQSDEDKEEGKEAKEKRVLYVLRPGKRVPERIFISPTSLRNWKSFCKSVIDREGTYYGFMCEFSAEHVAPAKSKYKWNKAKFEIDRRLTDEEMAHVEEVRALVDKRVKVYEDDSELDKYEDEAMGLRKGDDDEEVDKHSSKRRRDIEEDDDEDPKAGKPGKKGAKKSESKKKAKDDDDDEDEKPKSKKKSSDDDDDEDEKPKSKKKASDDDDDDEDEKPKSKKKASDDDDDEDEKPKSKKKSSDEDDDEDEKPKSKKKDGYPDLDDDDDEDLGSTKKKKSSDDDDDEDEKPKKKKPSLDDDDDED
jgi:hypothetical protein